MTNPQFKIYKLALENSSDFAVVSEQDFEKLAYCGWRLGTNGYVYKCGGRTRGRQVLLHRIILHTPKGKDTHHINGNKLDNRRENLEVLTRSEHQKKYHNNDHIKRLRSRRVYSEYGTCPECKKDFKKKPENRSTVVFCSKKCASLYNWRKRKCQI